MQLWGLSSEGQAHKHVDQQILASLYEAELCSSTKMSTAAVQHTSCLSTSRYLCAMLCMMNDEIAFVKKLPSGILTSTAGGACGGLT